MALRLSGARRRVYKLMTDACTIRRQQDRYAAGTLDPDTLELTEDPGDEVYAGKCFIVPSGLQARQDEAGGNDSSQKTYVLSIPFDGRSRCRADPTALAICRPAARC